MRSKKTFIVSVLLVGLVVVVGLLFAKFNRVYANAVPEFANLEVIEPQVVVSPTMEQVVTPLPKASVAASELTSKWNEKYLEKGKWVHFINQISSEVNNGVVLPDDGKMTSSYIEEGWYYVGQEGMIVKDVVTTKDINGNILQQSAFSEDVGINFTFNIKDENLTPYKLKVDRGFVQFLLDAEAFGVTTNYKELKNEGVPIMEFYYTEAYEKPVEFSGIQQAVESTYLSATFNADTGELISYSKVLNCVDGSEVLFEKVDVIRVESLQDAPSEITSILEQVK